MTLIKRRPRREMTPFFGGVDPLERLFGEMLTPWAGVRPTCGTHGEDAAFSPAVDVVREDDEIVVRADLPGVKSEDIELTVHDGVLTLKGTKTSEKKEETDHYHYFERSHGEFSRSFQLPEAVESDNVKAAFKDGVLEVRLPITGDAKPRRVAIEAN